LIKIYLAFLRIKGSLPRNTIRWAWFLKQGRITRQDALTILSLHSRPDDFRYLLAAVCPSRSSETPPACSWEPRNNYYEEKESHLRLQPLLLTVSSLRIQLRSATTVRISEKRGRCATPLLSFFVSPLTGATSPLLSLRCQIHSRENRYLWCFSHPTQYYPCYIFANNLFSCWHRVGFMYLILLHFLKINVLFYQVTRHLYDFMYKW